MPTSSTVGVLETEIRRAARADVPVLIIADDRQHRDGCARLIHAEGARVNGPFVAFFPDQAARLPGDTQLFRRARGAADAVMLRRLFERARGGTLFIDQIDRLTADAQRLILRLQERDVMPQARSGVRIVAGTHRPFDAEPADGLFAMLLFRVNVIRLDLTDAFGDPS